MSSLEERVQNLPDPTRDAALERLRLLRDHLLSVYDVTLRDDSRLAYKYCTNTLPHPYHTLEDVAHELFVVDRLHRTTSYATDVQVKSKEKAAELVARGLTWTQAWNVVKEHYFDAIKYGCLRCTWDAT